MHKLLLPAACGALIVSGAAHAQFGELLKNAVTNAATSAATSAAAHATTNAVNGAIRGATSPSTPPPPAARPATNVAPAPAAQHAGGGPAPLPESAGRAGCESTRTRKPLPPLGPRPANFPAALWPAEPACVYGFEDYDFTAGKEQARAFDQAGRVACSECVTGVSDDANAQGKLAVSGGLTKRFLEMLVTMQPGEKIEWKGARYRGTITLAGELPIGEFPCRQFHWTLTSKAGVVMAEREGLYCIWKHRSNDPVWTKVL